MSLTPDCLNRPAPKGQQDSAQGFNHGYCILRRRALKGHQTWGELEIPRIQLLMRIYSGATFRAQVTEPRYPGLKPWAESCRPFGALDEDDDSLSDEAQGLCCQPLEVGLASEARSTTRMLAKSEVRGR